MLPSVSLPWSPYGAASGSSPMPTLSSTMTIARWGAMVESGCGTADQASWLEK